MNSKEIKKRLESGDALIEVKTGNSFGYESYIRFTSDGETAPIKCLQSKALFGYQGFNYTVAGIVAVPAEIAIMKTAADYYNVKSSIHAFLESKKNNFQGSK